ncbi:MAG TPA: aminoglycoside phosphotransferase family protein, partial [Anaerolineales bacterium]|nr:aminoglycoside phosphotransferase family protein [Anaerolineales bacterium]
MNPSIKLRAGLPPDFIKTIHGTFGDDGRDMLARLPELIADASARWGLRDVQPVPNLSYNFVAFAKQGEGDVVLKVGVPRGELASEMAALRLFNGDGACRLLECDEERGMSLLERLSPGTMLSELEDDDERTHIAIDVMQKLWRPMESSGKPLAQEQAPALQKFIRLSDWFDGLKEIRPHFDGGTGPFPKEILERVEASLPGLFDDDARLMHGDFHHYNILKSERGWLGIDPKGVIGPVGYEIGPLMLNPWIKPMDRSRLKVQTERRVDIIRDRASLAREIDDG